jgi:UDP-GlcNAc:undecaprenyl-phosphate GlcNAc-1-phosphate transferase
MLLLAGIFFISAAISIFLWPVAAFMGGHFNIIDYPGTRKIHSNPTLRTGGILIFSGFIMGIFISGYQSLEWHFIMSFTLMFAVGLFGDMYQLSAKSRLILQTLIAVLYIGLADTLLVNLGVFVLPGFMQVSFTVFAIVGITNAFNIIDGIDGLSSGIGLIAASSLGILAYLHGDHEVLKLTILFAGANSGFMIFNLKGKIFMGDSGSYFVGFVIAVLSIMLATRNPDVSPFAPFLIVLIPVFDTLFAIWRRMSLKKNPFAADMLHLHHVLRKRYGSDSRALVVILLIQSAAALVAVLLKGHTIVLVGTAISMTFFLHRLWHGGLRLGKSRKSL